MAHTVKANVGNTVHNLIGPKFERQTFRSRDNLKVYSTDLKVTLNVWDGKHIFWQDCIALQLTRSKEICVSSNSPSGLSDSAISTVAVQLPPSSGTVSPCG